MNQNHADRMDAMTKPAAAPEAREGRVEQQAQRVEEVAGQIRKRLSEGYVGLFDQQDVEDLTEAAATLRQLSRDLEGARRERDEWAEKHAIVVAASNEAELAAQEAISRVEALENLLRRARRWGAHETTLHSEIDAALSEPTDEEVGDG